MGGLGSHRGQACECSDVGQATGLSRRIFYLIRGFRVYSSVSLFVVSEYVLSGSYGQHILGNHE